jgi:hypothetical protein
MEPYPFIKTIMTSESIKIKDKMIQTDWLISVVITDWSWSRLNYLIKFSGNKKLYYQLKLLRERERERARALIICIYVMLGWIEREIKYTFGEKRWLFRVSYFWQRRIQLICFSVFFPPLFKLMMVLRAC